jgi:ribosomal protein S18 acetylase RimI-like enzyme
MAQIEIRPANAEDRDAVLAFCQNTWEWGDYIERVWDDWLHNPTGSLIVATVGGKPVGIEHLQMLSSTDAWLEGIRVDPAYRRQGIAKALSDAILVEAMHRGATQARLATESTNIASITMVERNFWRRVAEFTLYNADPLPVLSRRDIGSDLPQLATQADLEEIILYLNTSSIFPLSGGLYYEGFTAYTISSDLIASKIDAKQLYLLRRWDRLDGLAFAEPRREWQGSRLYIGYIDGTTDSISLLAYTLRKQAADLGLERVTAHIPNLMMVQDAFLGAEYEWNGSTFYTYERNLV